MVLGATYADDSKLTLPTYFISHGGGPWPYVPEMREGYERLAASLRAIPSQLGRRPAAILMVSAHWETEGSFGVMSHPAPAMLYDYRGFPPHTYRIQYPAPGSPALADRVAQLLVGAGLSAHLDPDRGFDHGTFVPAYVMYPHADVPIVQLSIDKNHDPVLHVAMGRALAPLRDENVLIIGSGLSYHNLRMLGPQGAEPSALFDAWLQDALRQPAAERLALIEQWEHAPAARIAHAREDHLIPLMTALGAAENEPSTCVYHENTAFGFITASSFRFGR